MSSKFIVYSADWQIEVMAESHEEAAVSGTERMYKQLGKRFNIAYSVASVKEKDGSLDVFSSVAILEDMKLFLKARSLNEILNTLKS